MSESSDRLSQSKLGAVIKFLNKGQVGACEIHRRLCSMYGEDNVMAVYDVYRWVEICNGRGTGMHDDGHHSRPSNTVSDETVNIVRPLLDEDWHYMFNNL